MPPQPLPLKIPEPGARCWLVCTLVGATLAAPLPPAFAAPPAGPTAYRRVFVPADRPEVWPLQGERYLPIDADELATLEREAASAAIAHALSVELRAAVAGDGCLAGVGVMRIRVVGRGPAFVPWPNGAMAASVVRWRPGGSPDGAGGANPETPNQRQAPGNVADTQAAAAVLGYWPSPPEADPSLDAPAGLPVRAGRKGVYGVRVPGSGTLVFRFRLPAIAGGYTLPLPVAGRRELTVSLPRGVTPICRACLVEPVDGGDASRNASPQWRLRPESGAPLAFVLNNPRGDRAAEQPIRYAFACDAELLRGGLRRRTRLSLRSARPMPEEITLRSPAGVLLRRVELQGRVLPLRRGGRPGEVIVDLGGDAGARGLSLSLAAWNPVTPGEPTPLRAITPVGGRFEEGEFTLRAREPWAVTDLPQTAAAMVTPTGGPRAGFRIRHLTATARTTFTATREPAPPAVGIEAAVELSPASARATLTARLFDTTPAAPGLIRLPLQEAWRVDRVAGRGPAAVEGWRISRTPEGGRHLLITVMAQPAGGAAVEAGPAADATPPGFLITASRPMPPAGRIAAADLAVLPPRGCGRFRQGKIEVTAAGSWGLQITTGPGRRPRFDPFAITSAVEFNLTTDGGRSELSGARLSLRRQPRRVRTDLRVVTQLGGRGAGYRLAAELLGGLPGGAYVFRFTSPLSAGAVWSDSATGLLLSATRLPAGTPRPADEGRANGGSATGERWRITLPESASDSPTILVAARLPDAATLMPPLPAVEGAAEQTGAVVLRGPGALRRGVTATGLTPMPPRTDYARRYSYQPASVLDGRQPPQLGIRRPRSPIRDPVNPAWRLCSLRTTWSPGAGLSHHALLEGQNPWSRYRFSLPADVELIGVFDRRGVRLDTSPLGGDGTNRLYRVAELPERSDAGRGKNAYQMSIEYHQTPPAAAGRITALLPQPAPATDPWEWIVLTPRQWRFESGEPPEVPWRRRLFGPLAGPPGVQPFNPLAGADWRNAPRAAGAFLGGLHLSPVSIDPRQPPAPPGWRRCTVTALAAPEGRLTDLGWQSYRSAAVTLLAAGLAAWRLAPRPARLASVTLLAAAGVLAAPTEWLPPVRSAWLGVIVAWPVAWCIARRRAPLAAPAARAAAPERRPRGANQPAAPLLLTAVAILAAPGGADGRPPPDDGPASETQQPIEPVLVPVDAAGDPVGNTLHVREQRLKRLLRGRVARGRAAPGNVAIQRVAIQGRLLPGPPGEPTRTGTWRMTLRCRTLQPGATLRLPLPRSAADWPVSASVDGLPRPLAWGPDDSATLSLSGPGPRSISIDFRPRLRTAEGRSGIRFPLPPAPACSLVVRRPRSIGNPRAPAALAISQKDSTLLRATLDGAAGVELRWTEPSRADQPVSPTDALVLVRLGVDGVTARVKAVGDGGGGDGLRLCTPAGWRPIGEPDAPLVRVAAGPDSHATLGARFRLERDSPLGEYYLPALASPDREIGRTVIAVAPADGYTIADPDGLAGVGLDAAGFAALWAGDEPAPDAAAGGPHRDADARPRSSAPGPTPTQATIQATSVLRPGQTWRLAVTPAAYAAQPSQRLSMAIGLDCVRVNLAISGVPIDASHIALQTPADFRAARVGVSTRPGEACRWSRPRPDRLVIWLPQPLTFGAQVLVDGVAASLPLGTRAPLPVVALAPAQAAPLAVSLYRPTGVSVEFADPLDATAEGPPLPPAGWRVLPIAATVLSTPEEAPAVIVTASRPCYTTREVASYKRAAAGLTAEWAADVRVTRGELTALPVRVAMRPGARVALRSPAGASFIPAPTPNRLGEIVFAQPLRSGESTLIRLGADLSEPGASMPAPWATLPGAEASDVAIAFPAAQAPGGRWAPTGLRPLDKPRRVAPALLTPGPWRFFEPTTRSTPGRAVWVPGSAAGGTIRAPIAQHRCVATAGALRAIDSRFLIVPRSQSHCVLRPPTGSRLVTVAIGPHEAAAERLPDGAWRVALHAADMPQVLTTRILQPRDHATPRAPSLEDSAGARVRPRRTAWISPRRRAGNVGAPPDARQIDAQQAAQLWQACVAHVRPAGEPSRSSPLLTAARWRADAAGAKPGPNDGGGWLLRSPESAAADRPGPTPAPPAPDSQPARFALAAACVAAALALRRFGTHAALQTTVREHRHAAVGAVGLAWWLLMQPSFFGLVLLLASAIGQAVQFAARRSRTAA